MSTEPTLDEQIARQTEWASVAQFHGEKQHTLAKAILASLNRLRALPRERECICDDHQGTHMRCPQHGTDYIDHDAVAREPAKGLNQFCERNGCWLARKHEGPCRDLDGMVMGALPREPAVGTRELIEGNCGLRRLLSELHTAKLGQYSRDLDRAIAALSQSSEQVFDVDALAWQSIKDAAAKSPWIPQQYCMSDWVSDVCEFLSTPVDTARERVGPDIGLQSAACDEISNAIQWLNNVRNGVCGTEPAIRDMEAALKRLQAFDTSRERGELTATDYEEVLADHRRLVRELDVLLHGEGAAKQASLCDIVAQAEAAKRRAPAAAPVEMERDARLVRVGRWMRAEDAPAGRDGIVRQELSEGMWRYLFGELRTVRGIEGWFDPENTHLVNVTYWMPIPEDPAHLADIAARRAAIAAAGEGE